MESNTKRVSNRNGEAAKAYERMAVPKNIGDILYLHQRIRLLKDRTKQNLTTQKPTGQNIKLGLVLY